MSSTTSHPDISHGECLAHVVHISDKRITPARVQWRDGVITAIEGVNGAADKLPYLIPGFVDAHVHIESSMLTPAEFGRIAVRHGTVAVVTDPHEIANVLGEAGMQFMLDNGHQTPFVCHFGAPSCVPATAFETAGAVLDSRVLNNLLDNPDVHFLSEVMNYPGVLAGDADLLAKLRLAREKGMPIDGHAPGLLGEPLRRYVGERIITDHECTEMAEAEAKLAAGMAILIREGSAARNFEALHQLIGRYPDRVMFCSDDKHPDDLQAGHINSLVARAVAYRHDVFDVLQCACLNPIRHYGLPLGQLRVGDRMDAALVKDLVEFKVLKTWIAGRCVAEDGKSLLPHIKPRAINRFQARYVAAGDFQITGNGRDIRVIEAYDGQLLTGQRILKPKLRDGRLEADMERDLLWLAVVNRYRPEPPAVAFITGFGLRYGALASSVAHDSHNIVAVGCDIESLCNAVNAVIDCQGGIACVSEAGLACLLLPIAGLMSDQDGDSVAARYAELDAIAKTMGSTLRAPFMTLSFMALLVIPELKLSDQGLFDGKRFQFTSLLVKP
jgi:adenine deaminase